MDSDHPPATDSRHRVVREFRVAPRLPNSLTVLESMARNLWWTWDPDARELFESVDPGRLRRRRHNARLLLQEVSQERLNQLAEDERFLEKLARVDERFRAAMTGSVQIPVVEHGERPARVAYFCAEYGLHESLPFYSGGLGVLAGDTLKAASDRGVDLVAVGLAYHHGYFEQRIGPDGRQLERYPVHDFDVLPMTALCDKNGDALTVQVPIGARTVTARLWWVAVGRVPLILLDTTVANAPDEDRAITARLYGGDHRLRLEQEVLLGVGGMRALAALGIEPECHHMNEGHSVLLTLEQTADLMKRESLSFQEAQALASATNVFTTHTPVAAGHDEFDLEMAREYLTPLAAHWGLEVESLLALGSDPGHPGKFSMTVLGLRMSRYRNGVSRLHGEVSRRMWRHLWPELSNDEIPIDSITNGVHAPSWLAPELHALFDREREPGFTAHAIDTPGASPLWTALRQLPSAPLFESREVLRRRLIHELSQRLRLQNQRLRLQNDSAPIGARLDPRALTIGFCRRFATYKRAHLLFQDLERLERLLGNEDRPVQFVFAGKAHPRDEPGKEFVRMVVEHSQRESLKGRLVFVEGYDIELARCLVQGVDVWLNTPRRPHEASGTSGMKAAMNGALNLSIADGWWCEGYHGGNGWTIGAFESAEQLDEGAQDGLDAAALYELLEREVVPQFYDRDEQGIPQAWMAMVKESLASLSGVFSAHRMISEYERRFYAQALRAGPELLRDGAQPVRELTRWLEHVRSHWHEVGIQDVQAPLSGPFAPGDEIGVRVWVRLGSLEPDQLRVELLHGPIGPDGELEEPSVAVARAVERDHQVQEYSGSLRCRRTGRLGLAVRVRPFAAGAELLAAPTLFHWS